MPAKPLPQTPPTGSGTAKDSSARGSSPPLPYARQWIDEDDIAAVAGVLRSDNVTGGPAIEEFENGLTAATGAKYAVVVSSGTAALHLACLAGGLGPGRTGVTSPITFAASANCFLYVGAKAAFADVDPVTGLIHPHEVESLLATRAAAGEPPGTLIPVSLAGRVPDLAELAAIGARHGWSVIEDAAHSLGATYRAEGAAFRSGSCAHTRAAILSFHPVKHICSGEGGAVLTNDAGLAEHVRRLRSHGIDRSAANRGDSDGGWFYEQMELGYNYRLTDMQAALGLSQLRKLPRFLERRRELARRYAAVLAGDPFARVLRVTPFDPEHAYHLFVVHFHDAALRRKAYDHLAKQNIRSQVHYLPVYRHPHYRRLEAVSRLPGAERYYAGCLSLPLFPVMTDSEQERVIETLAAFAQSHG